MANDAPAKVFVPNESFQVNPATGTRGYFLTYESGTPGYNQAVQTQSQQQSSGIQNAPIQSGAVSGGVSSSGPNQSPAIPGVTYTPPANQSFYTTPSNMSPAPASLLASEFVYKDANTGAIVTVPRQSIPFNYDPQSGYINYKDNQPSGITVQPYYSGSRTEVNPYDVGATKFIPLSNASASQSIQLGAGPSGPNMSKFEGNISTNQGEAYAFPQTYRAQPINPSLVTSNPNSLEGLTIQLRNLQNKTQNSYVAADRYLIMNMPASDLPAYRQFKTEQAEQLNRKGMVASFLMGFGEPVPILKAPTSTIADIEIGGVLAKQITNTGVYQLESVTLTKSASAGEGVTGANIQSNQGVRFNLKELTGDERALVLKTYEPQSGNSPLTLTGKAKGYTAGYTQLPSSGGTLNAIEQVGPATFKLNPNENTALGGRGVASNQIRTDISKGTPGSVLNQEGAALTPNIDVSLYAPNKVALAGNPESLVPMKGVMLTGQNLRATVAFDEGATIGGNQLNQLFPAKGYGVRFAQEVTFTPDTPYIGVGNAGGKGIAYGTSSGSNLPRGGLLNLAKNDLPLQSPSSLSGGGKPPSQFFGGEGEFAVTGQTQVSRLASEQTRLTDQTIRYGSSIKQLNQGGVDIAIRDIGGGYIPGTTQSVQAGAATRVIGATSSKSGALMSSFVPGITSNVVPASSKTITDLKQYQGSVNVITSTRTSQQQRITPLGTTQQIPNQLTPYQPPVTIPQITQPQTVIQIPTTIQTITNTPVNPNPYVPTPVTPTTNIFNIEYPKTPTIPVGWPIPPSLSSSGSSSPLGGIFKGPRKNKYTQSLVGLLSGRTTRRAPSSLTGLENRYPIGRSLTKMRKRVR